LRVSVVRTPRISNFTDADALAAERGAVSWRLPGRWRAGHKLARHPGRRCVRRAFLTEVAALARRDFMVAPDTDFAAVRQARLDVLGDLVAEHLDTAALRALIERGPPPGLPLIPSRGSS
jgi:cobyric acid synthase